MRNESAPVFSAMKLVGVGVLALTAAAVATACGGSGSVFVGHQKSWHSQTTRPIPFLATERSCDEYIAIARLALDDVGDVESAPEAEVVRGVVDYYEVSASCSDGWTTYTVIGERERPPPPEKSFEEAFLDVVFAIINGPDEKSGAERAVDRWQRAERPHERAYDARAKTD